MPVDISDPLDVLLLVGAVQLRGSSSRAFSLADQLLARRYDVSLVVNQSPPEASRRFQKAQVRVSPYLNVSLLGRLARRFLASDLKEQPPDLIDIQHRSLHGVGSWLARRIKRPYLVTVHDFLRDRETFVVDREWCRGVVAVSDAVRTELLQRTSLRDEDVVVISGGVTLPGEDELQPILADDQAPVIGTAGPLEAGKGLKHFLLAAALVLKEYPAALFLVSGSGPEERTLRRMAQELGVGHAVSILPNLRDFDSALRAMDIFVLPALKPGLGAIMLEAMARRLPVIATESGGVFTVIEDGVTGLLVPPSDEHALADRMKFLLQNPSRARELGIAARVRVGEHFQLEKMVLSTLQLYHQVAWRGEPVRK